MIPRFRLVNPLSHSRSYGWVLGLGESCSPSKKSSLGCRLIQMTLALYLIPAFLIVLLVGAVGILVVGVIRFFTRLLGTTHGWREARPGSLTRSRASIDVGMLRLALRVRRRYLSTRLAVSAPRHHLRQRDQEDRFSSYAD